MEANAELIMMASLYASHTGDRALFRTAPERLLCAEAGEGQWSYVGVGRWTPDACSARPAALLGAHPQLYGDFAHAPHVTVPRGKSKPGLYPGQGTILVSRVTLRSAATALSLALTAGYANFTVCVRDVASDTVVGADRCRTTAPNVASPTAPATASDHLGRATIVVGSFFVRQSRRLQGNVSPGFRCHLVNSCGLGEKGAIAVA